MVHYNMNDYTGPLNINIPKYAFNSRIEYTLRGFIFLDIIS